MNATRDVRRRWSVTINGLELFVAAYDWQAAVRAWITEAPRHMRPKLDDAVNARVVLLSGGVR